MKHTALMVEGCLWRASLPTALILATFVLANSACAEEPSSNNPFLPPGAQDLGWPFLRGSHFDAHSPEIHLADSWPETGPPVVWVRDLGQGFSAVVVVGSRAFTQYQTISGQYVVCLNANTGEELWHYRYDWPYELNGLYPGPRSTPTVHGGQVYFVSPVGIVACLTQEGKLNWSVDLYKRFGGERPGFGYACSPVVADGLVFMPVGSPGASMVALDAHTGATRWQAGDDPASYTPAFPITVNGRRQIVGYLENTLVGHDFHSGAVLWRLSMSQGYDEHAAWPIYVEPWLWISGPFQSGSRMLHVPESAAEPLVEVWQTKLLSNDVCSSVFHNGYLYGFDLRDIQSKAYRPSRGTFRCLEFKTGEERWAAEEVGHASALVADEKLILFSDRGELILIRATHQKYAELARAKVLGEEICWTPPTLHRGCVYVRDHARAMCLYIGEPDLLGRASVHPTQRLEDLPPATTSRGWSRLLGVEPAIALDVPRSTWFWNWYLAGLAIIATGECLAVVITFIGRLATGSWPTAGTRNILFRLGNVTGGAIGTTLLSQWYGDFVFTWPVVIWVLFQMTVDQTRPRSPAMAVQNPWRGRFVLVLFLAGGLGYYWLCRQLGLATEWAFLCGFAGALPFALLRQVWQRRYTSTPANELILSMAEFSGFYAVSIAIMLWRM